MAEFLNLELNHEGYDVDICYDGKNGYETVDRADPRRYGRCDCAEQSVVPHGARR